MEMKTIENKRTTGKEPFRFVICSYRNRPTDDCNAVNWDVTERGAQGKFKEIDCSIRFEDEKSELSFNATRTHLTSLSEHCDIPKRIEFVFRSFIV